MQNALVDVSNGRLELELRLSPPPLSSPTPIDPLKGPYWPFKRPLLIWGDHKTDITFLTIFKFSITIFEFFQTIWDGYPIIDPDFLRFWKF